MYLSGLPTVAVGPRKRSAAGQCPGEQIISSAQPQRNFPRRGCCIPTCG
jgi:hypothetical protein